MNSADQEYERLLNVVLAKGRRKKNRTGVDTFGVFGEQARFDLNRGFPLLTTKKVFFKGILHELLWFIAGDTNIKYLVDNGCNFWNANAFAHYQKKFAGSDLTYGNIEDYIVAIKSADWRDEESETFLKAAADLGEGTYGGMWRAFPYTAKTGGTVFDCSGQPSPHIMHGAVDQLAKVIDKLQNSPDDRRIIVSAWHPYWVDHCALPPCHVMFHFNTEELTEDERYYELIKRKPYADDCCQSEIRDLLVDIPTRRLNCLLYQRSCDLFLGVPFNIASYALLTQMIAHCVDMIPGEFIHTFGDLHLYENHIAQAKEQLARVPFDPPTVTINPEKRDFFSLGFEDISLNNYQSHPPLKASMAV